jgi:hypothetical protein
MDTYIVQKIMEQLGSKQNHKSVIGSMLQFLLVVNIKQPYVAATAVYMYRKIMVEIGPKQMHLLVLGIV